MLNFLMGPHIRQILDQQFNLSYFCHMSWKDSQEMIPFEREFLHNRLEEQHNFEKKEMEEMTKELK